uniref:PDZ domain-containing protein n=1 Tax=Macrostomum lignano TaxID=282301 RepID=A0A1I8JI69_9PLAT
PLIPLRHQIAYDARALRPPSDRPALVQLQRSGAASSAFGEPEPYGFSVRVNGFRIDRAISAELADLVRSRNDLSLRVRRVGLIPRRIVPDDPLSWEHISPELLNTHRDTVRVFLNVRDAGGVGCSVASDGPPDRPNGVFIRSVKVGSPAEQVGLEVGDELLEANGQRLSGLPHSATVVALKASPHLLLTVRKARPLPDYPTDEDSALASSAAAAASVSPIYEEGSSGYAELNSASSPTGGRGSGGGGGGVSSVVGGGSTVTIDLHKSPPPGGRVTRGEFQLERPHPATAARHGDTFEEQEITTYF